jgi:hypothetical protein
LASFITSEPNILTSKSQHWILLLNSKETKYLYSQTLSIHCSRVPFRWLFNILSNFYRVDQFLVSQQSS